MAQGNPPPDFPGMVLQQQQLITVGGVGYSVHCTAPHLVQARTAQETRGKGVGEGNGGVCPALAAAEQSSAASDTQFDKINWH